MILVTGGSGFLGRHLLEVLAARPEPVRALYHSRSPQAEWPHVHWQRCDLLDIKAVEEAMQGITAVYHCAATVSYDPRMRNAMIHGNVTGTAHVADAALEAGVRRFVHVSSIASLGRSIGPEGAAPAIDENTHWEESKANSPYAESKFLAEMEVWRAMAEGLEAVIVNPGIILGEGDWDKGSARLMQIVHNEFPWYTEGINAWVDVKDVAAALILLMDSDVSDERYILSAGNFSYKEVFTEMAHALGRRPPFKHATPFLSEIVWRAEVIKSRLAGKEVTISKDSARTAQARCYYDNGKFLRQFPGFSYRSLKETVTRMAAAYLHP